MSWTWTPLEAPPVPECTTTYVAPIDLPAGQKMALLLLRKGELANKIVDHLREWGAPQPTEADWRAMIEARYVMRRMGRRMITPMGLSAVESIARDLARKIGVHHVSYGGGRGTGRWARCSCGWQTIYADHRGADIALMRFASDHLRAVHPAQLVDVFQPLEQSHAPN